MERNFITLTQSDVNAKLAAQIKSRELELMSYDFERATHESGIASLADIAWDDSIIQYRGMTRDQMVASTIADGLTTEQIQKVADLNALDRHLRELEAVKIETAKSERTYNALLAALPEGEARDAAFAAVPPVQKQA